MSDENEKWAQDQKYAVGVAELTLQHLRQLTGFAAWWHSMHPLTQKNIRHDLANIIRTSYDVKP